MEISCVLEKAKAEPVSKDEALLLLHEINTLDEMCDLFRVATEVRNECAGAAIKIESTMDSIRACKITPPCRYCTRSANRPCWSSALTFEEMLVSAKEVAGNGGRVIHAYGGSDLNGDGSDIVEAVNLLRNQTRLEVCVSTGPNYSIENLRELKRLGTKEIGCALETVNKDVFKAAKPGDSLEIRKRLIENLDKVGLKLYTCLMVGLGTYEDYMDCMCYLNTFRNLSCLTIARFHPEPGTPLENKLPASPLDAAKVLAVARLFFRNVDISMGGGHLIFLPLAMLAGANRAQVGEYIFKSGDENPDAVYGARRKAIGSLWCINRRPIAEKFIKEAGLKVLSDW